MICLNDRDNSKRNSLILFFILTYIISWPFFIIAALAAQGILPTALVNLWYSGAAAPLLAALILIYKEKKGEGIKNLFRRGFKYNISRKAWYIPIFLLLPIIFLLALGPLFLIEGNIPNPALPFWLILPMFALFFSSALGEELGWRGYAFDPMQERWKALTATMVLGPIWVIWHLPLFISGIIGLGTPLYVLGLCLCLMGVEILHTWIYNNTDKSIFTVILFHSLYNICTLFLPNFVVESGPFITSLFILLVAILIILIYGTRKLSRSSNSS